MAYRRSSSRRGGSASRGRRVSGYTRVRSSARVSRRAPTVGITHGDGRCCCTCRVKEAGTAGAWRTSVQISATAGALTSIDQSTSLLVTADNRYHITYINASTPDAGTAAHG